MIGVPTCPACGAHHYEEQCPLVRRFRRALLVLPMLLCGCAPIRTGHETAALAARLEDAQGTIVAAQHSAKEVRALSGRAFGHVHSAYDFNTRADGKTGRAIRTLRESLR